MLVYFVRKISQCLSLNCLYKNLFMAYRVIWIRQSHHCNTIDVNCLNSSCTTFPLLFNCTNPCSFIPFFRFDAKSITTIFDARITTIWHRYSYRLREFWKWNSIFVKWLELLFLKTSKNFEFWICTYDGSEPLKNNKIAITVQWSIQNC